MADELWGRVRDELCNAVGQNNYKRWIEPLVFLGIEGDVAKFAGPTSFLGDWVQRNFGEQLVFHLNEAGAGISRLEIGVAARGADHQSASKAPAPSNAARQEAEESELPGAPLDPRFTFDSFVVGKPNELAHAAARRVGEGGEVAFNPLFLYGGVGLGKTHLMHAIAHELQQRQGQLKVVYLSAEQFMYRFIRALRERQMMDFKELFRSVDVLMVDDVQFIAGKESTQEEFFHTFNALVDQRQADRDFRRPRAGRDQGSGRTDQEPPAMRAGRGPAPHRLRAAPRHPAAEGAAVPPPVSRAADLRRCAGVPRPPDLEQRPRARRVR
jgi:chromosomal replication initiator protein